MRASILLASVVTLLATRVSAQSLCSVNHVHACGGVTDWVGAACTTYPFTIQPCSGGWNVFGACRDANSGATRRIDIGGVTISNLSGANTNFIVADGHAPGAIGPNSGAVVRGSVTGDGLIRLGSVTTLNLVYNPGNGQLESNGNYSWNISSSASGSLASASVVRMFQFQVTTPGDYSVLLDTVGNAPASNNASYLEFAFFRPNGSSAWRGRSSNDGAFGSSNLFRTFTDLIPGWYGIVVFKDGSPPAQTGNGFFNLIVRAVPLPAPNPGGISASPVRACAGNQTITLTGPTLVLASRFRVGSTMLQANPTNGSASVVLPQNVVGSVESTVPLTIENPPPGGGLATLILPVLPLGPITLAPPSPPQVVYKRPTTVSLSGSGFTAGILVNIAGQDFQPSSVQPNSLTLGFSGSEAFLASPGVKSVVANDLCNGQSPGQSLIVALPSPGSISVQPPSIKEGSSALTLTVRGPGVTDLSALQFDGASVASIFAPPDSLTTTVPASQLAIARTVSICVTNPLPILGGGPSSSCVPFTIELPYPGTNEDLVIETSVGNLSFSTGPGNSIKNVVGGDILGVHIFSRTQLIDGSPFALYGMLYPTVPPPSFVPPLGLPNVFIGGPSTFALPTPGIFGQSLLPAGSGAVAYFMLPAGLAGSSVMLQAVALSPLGTVVPGVMLSDGHEIRF